MRSKVTEDQAYRPFCIKVLGHEGVHEFEKAPEKPIYTESQLQSYLEQVKQAERTATLSDMRDTIAQARRPEGFTIIDAIGEGARMTDAFLICICLLGVCIQILLAAARISQALERIAKTLEPKPAQRIEEGEK